ncbi:hypothetical protein LEP1GSC170_1910 [Leptospira interrogans serovar Bataviae str. HAI135]|nr:hypothetical protein LEP1GSC170_1910 [Leptospira interrogans serovar Bataviae str. HAI135]
MGLYEFPQILSRFKFFETFIFRDSVPTFQNLSVKSRFVRIPTSLAFTESFPN